jgi:hypothetical protein
VVPAGLLRNARVITVRLFEFISSQALKSESPLVFNDLTSFAESDRRLGVNSRKPADRWGNTVPLGLYRF